MNDTMTKSTAPIEFNFNSNTIRVISDEHGNPWFIAKDVADILGYTNPSEAVRDNCKKANYLKNILNSQQLVSNEINDLRSTTLVIPESDVYRLTLRSKLDSAEVFQDWVVEDVIPTIRKTGSYSTPQTPKVDPKYVSSTAKAMLSMAKAFGFKGNQAILSADKATMKFTGHSPLKLLDTELVSENKSVILTPTEIGMRIGGLSAQKINKMLDELGFQSKVADQWQPTDKGKPFGEMLDTSKKHSDGTPVKQWKWFSSIVDQINAVGGV